MNMKSMVSALPLSAALLCASLGSGPAAAYPAVGQDTLGPQLIINLNSNGTATVVSGPGSAQGPYDGNEDTYIGVQNNTSQTINAITITGNRVSGISIFEFDGDGIGAPIAGLYPGSGVQQYGTINPFDAAHAANGCTNVSGGPCTGYAGPIGFFSGIVAGSGSNPIDSGVLNFAGGLAAGQFTWFSLEEALDTASFTVSTVPGPIVGAGLPGLIAAFAGFVGWCRRRRQAV